MELAFIKNEIVMKMENINIPPSPYKCRVLRPVRSINGIEASVITTCNLKPHLELSHTNRSADMNNVTTEIGYTIIAPIPMVANFAFSSVKPALVNKNVE